jgi:hypothetical protein
MGVRVGKPRREYNGSCYICRFAAFIPYQNQLFTNSKSPQPAHQSRPGTRQPLVMSIPLFSSETSTSGVRVSVYDDPCRGRSIQTLSTTSALDRSLCQDHTHNIEFGATSQLTRISSPSTGDASKSSAVPAPKPPAVTLFAPTATRLDPARRPHTPFRRPDTPHPRPRSSTEKRPVCQQNPSAVLQTTKQSATRSQSHHCDNSRENFKHAMFLAWLDHTPVKRRD